MTQAVGIVACTGAIAEVDSVNRTDKAVVVVMTAINGKNISLLFQLLKFAALTGQSRRSFAVFAHIFYAVHALIKLSAAISVGRLGTLCPLRNFFKQFIYFVNRNMLKNDRLRIDLTACFVKPFKLFLPDALISSFYFCARINNINIHRCPASVGGHDRQIKCCSVRSAVVQIVKANAVFHPCVDFRLLLIRKSRFTVMVAKGQHKWNIKAFKNAEKPVDCRFNILSALFALAPKVNNIKLIARENYQVGLYIFYRRLHKAKRINTGETIVLQIRNLQNLKMSVVEFYLFSHAQFNHRFDYIIKFPCRQLFT